MSLKKWTDLDIDHLELLEVTEMEKARVKQHVLKKHKKAPRWRNIVVASIIVLSATITTGFAFPTIASQIPFMENIIGYFTEDERSSNFETFSTDVGLVETSNGTTVMIENAVYDGTNITVSYAIETEHSFGDKMDILSHGWFDVKGSIGGGGSGEMKRISDTRYVGIASITPHFKDALYPEMVQVTWKPEKFTDFEGSEIKGDWYFAFSLERLEGNLELLNETVQNEDVTFTLQSIEYTPVSTVISYEQVVTDELLKTWESVTPTFRVTDDLGHVYLDELGGGGMSHDNGKTFMGTTEFSTIQEGASQLIIQPIEIASLNFGEGHIKIELDPIVIDLKK
ncbi:MULTISPECIES: DUF4179 domain-containing protein [Solibacillus]|uniref:DUF4179 domain-containing protein n=1 Tax=Solibacillus merdavium TaxID=2762218 RepID=A0ABR8XN26_9BACL|nr:DUF4179 domain-containing protein [Solibacillus merdavium]MBD8033322.1 DUF4179 domain-containing protein [Solibacillus merdavium]